MSEVLYFLYSTNSPACQPLLPVMKKISNYITVHPIDIDLDVSIRKRIETTDIQTVPCLLVHTPDKIMILENEQLDQFIHKLIAMIQQQQQSAIPPEAQVTSLVNPNELRPPPPPTETSYNANVNSRLNPMEFSGPPMDVQQPQSKAEKSVNFDDMLISGGNESTPSTSGSEGGYTIDDIIGTGGGGAKSSKAADEKTSKVRSFAETMKLERDEADSKYRTPSS